MAKGDKAQEAKAPETTEGKAPEQEAQDQADYGLDGASLEALAVAKSRARAQGFEMDEENFVASEEDANESGWMGYSPTGAGENDAEHMRSKSSRLDTLGEFGEGV